MQIRIIVLLALLSLLAACSSTPSKQPEPLASDISALLRQPDPIPVREPPSKTGNPATYVVFGKRYQVLTSSAGFSEQGMASWYGKKFHGRKTSSGARYDMYKTTAAHKSLPIPTYARVTRLDNGRSIVVKINDRGPFVKGRIIDLSYAAAVKLDMLKEGTVPVEVVALSPYQTKPGGGGKQLAQQQKRQTITNDAMNDTMDNIMAASADQPTTPSLKNHSSQNHSSNHSSNVQKGIDLDTFFLQAGAFSKRHSAERLQQRLSENLDHQTHIREQGGLYKVRIGPLTNHADLAPLTRQLTGMGLERPRVVY